MLNKAKEICSDSAHEKGWRKFAIYHKSDRTSGEKSMTYVLSQNARPYINILEFSFVTKLNKCLLRVLSITSKDDKCKCYSNKKHFL